MFRFDPSFFLAASRTPSSFLLKADLQREEKLRIAGCGLWNVGGGQNYFFG
jgi:hypothetical protein